VSRTRAVVILIVAILLWTSLAFAQESLQSAKDLYASAAYDDALNVLSRLRVIEPKPEVEQYRVLCLVALGRHAEAEEAVRAVVGTSPTFVPDPSEVSPRIQELFARTRRQLLPEIARRIYLDAKAAFDRKDREAAQSGFDGLLRLVDSAGPQPEGALPELRLLAAGFLDLSRALPDPVRERTTASAVPAKPARLPEITPPVAIRQVMPQWVPSDTLSRQGSFTGAVRVSISATGRVEAATIERSVHPAYDRLLLQAARSWEYQPARSDGVQVPSDQLVQVQLKPRQ
jgi:TonB family protein